MLFTHQSKYFIELKKNLPQYLRQNDFKIHSQGRRLLLRYFSGNIREVLMWEFSK